MHLLAQLGQLRLPLLPRGTTLQLERPSPAYAGDVREPEEVERLGAAPLALAILAGVPPEPKDPGFVRVKLQAELHEAGGQRLPHRARVLFVLEAHHEVV